MSSIKVAVDGTSELRAQTKYELNVVSYTTALANANVLVKFDVDHPSCEVKKSDVLAADQ